MAYWTFCIVETLGELLRCFRTSERNLNILTVLGLVNLKASGKTLARRSVWARCFTTDHEDQWCRDHSLRIA